MNWEKKFTQMMGSKKSIFIHTIFFLAMLSMPLFGTDLDTVLLVLTTLVSLEAIYLSLFIQMTVNENTASLHEVEEDLEGIQEDVDEISTDIDEIQQDVDEIQADVDEIQEDVDEITTEVNQEESEGDLENIRKMLTKLLEEVDRIKNTK